LKARRLQAFQSGDVVEALADGVAGDRLDSSAIIRSAKSGATANPETIQAALDQIGREMKVRDEGLRRAFEILCGAIERNGQTLGMIHEQTVAVRRLVEEHLESLDERIHNAVADALDDHFNPLVPLEDVVHPPARFEE
jgi:hypothetical protein